MFRLALVTLTFLLLSNHSLLAQQSEEERIRSELRKLSWQYGPSQGRIGANAVIRVPENHFILQARDTSRFLVLMGNLPADERYAFGPDDLSWFAIFSFSEIGYVKDDEKIDPDRILESLKANNTEANEQRRARGIEPLYLDGWFVPPHYDLQTKRLEWGTKLRSPNNTITVNYHIRILGRSGVMNALLVSDPASLTSDIREFKSNLDGFSFDAGQRYSEFRAGDRVAEIGLSALILGGAAAVAAKSGIFKILGKFAIYIFGALAALLFGIVRAILGSRRSTS